MLAVLETYTFLVTTEKELSILVRLIVRFQRQARCGAMADRNFRLVTRTHKDRYLPLTRGATSVARCEKRPDKMHSPRTGCPLADPQRSNDVAEDIHMLGSPEGSPHPLPMHTEAKLTIAMREGARCSDGRICAPERRDISHACQGRALGRGWSHAGTW